MPRAVEHGHADERKLVLSALRGVARTTYDPLGHMVENLGREILPSGLDLETATKRLLHALRKANHTGFRRVMDQAADGSGLYVTRDDPKAPKATAKVDALLKEVDRTGTLLLEWGERLQRRGHAVVVRSNDPGVSDPDKCCSSCGMPNLAVVAMDRLDRSKDGWVLIVAPGQGK